MIPASRNDVTANSFAMGNRRRLLSRQLADGGEIFIAVAVC